MQDHSKYRQNFIISLGSYFINRQYISWIQITVVPNYHSSKPLYSRPQVGAFGEIGGWWGTSLISSAFTLLLRVDSGRPASFVRARDTVEARSTAARMELIATLALTVSWYKYRRTWESCGMQLRLHNSGVWHTLSGLWEWSDILSLHGNTSCAGAIFLPKFPKIEAEMWCRLIIDEISRSPDLECEFPRWGDSEWVDMLSQSHCRLV